MFSPLAWLAEMDTLPLMEGASPNVELDNTEPLLIRTEAMQQLLIATIAILSVLNALAGEILCVLSALVENTQLGHLTPTQVAITLMGPARASQLLGHHRTQTQSTSTLQALIVEIQRPELATLVIDMSTWEMLSRGLMNWVPNTMMLKSQSYSPLLEPWR